ncbi:MAG: thioredoxin domain-containing protein [Candidatus Bathyarchaeota archaeon]|jgi:thioredoxin 1
MSKVLEVDANDWQKEVLESEVLTVVDFWHEHCSWCIKLNPVIEEVAKELEEVRFVKMNVLKTMDNRKIAIENGIMSTPTLIFFCKGRSVSHHLGFLPKDDLKKKIEEIIEEYKACIRQSTPLET